MSIQFTNDAVELILQTMRETGLDPENTVFDIGLKEENLVIGFIHDGSFSKLFNGLKVHASLQLAKRYDVLIETSSESIGLVFTQKKLF